MNRVIDFYHRIKTRKWAAPDPVSTDIYIAEFPKSGITWLSTLTLNALHLNGDCPIRPTFYNVQTLIPDIHIIGRQTIGPSPFKNISGRLIKTHHQNCQHYKNAIYLVRHPVSVMTSYFNYMVHVKNPKMSDYQFIKSNAYGINAWKRHVDSWINNQKHWQRIHLVKYESLVADPVDTLSSLFQNLGCTLSPETLNNAVSLSNADKMRETESLMAMHNPGYKMHFVKSEHAPLSTNAIEYILETSKAEIEILGYS